MLIENLEEIRLVCIFECILLYIVADDLIEFFTAQCILAKIVWGALLAFTVTVVFLISMTLLIYPFY